MSKNCGRGKSDGDCSATNKRGVRRCGATMVIPHDYDSGCWVLGVPLDLTCSQRGCADVSESLCKKHNNKIDVKFWPDHVDRSVLIALIGFLEPIVIFLGQ